MPEEEHDEHAGFRARFGRSPTDSEAELEEEEWGELDGGGAGADMSSSGDGVTRADASGSGDARADAGGSGDASGSGEQQCVIGC